MPEIAMNKSSGESGSSKPNGHYVPYKEIFNIRSPRSPLSTHSRDSESIDLSMERGGVDTSIDQLYHNVYDMQSSDHSPSRCSFLSYGQESRIDSELRFLAGGDYVSAEDAPKEVAVTDQKQNTKSQNVFDKENSPRKGNNVGRIKKMHSASSPRLSHLQESDSSPRPSPKSKALRTKPPAPVGRQNGKVCNETSSPLARGKFPVEVLPEGAYLGPYLLKQTREAVYSGENPKKVLEMAQRAMKAFEYAKEEKPNLEFVMCLHVVAALHSSLGQYNEAVPLLERSIEIPAIDEGQEHALAKFAGCMQLGDTYAMLDHIENSILFYTAGLEIQSQTLGENDPRFGETCRYVAEAHVQSLQFDDAEKLCKKALAIHKENGSTASIEEAADRRLMGLICDAKGDYESALEHYVLAGMAMAANGQDSDVASIDCSIGDAYLSLARYDEAIFSYQKALTSFKSTNGENHPSVASVFVRLADLYNKVGKFRESKSYCENALRIYVKPLQGIPQEEMASGLIEVSTIYQSMNEMDKARDLLIKALKVYSSEPGHQSTIAGIQAQMGVLHYMMGSYTEAYECLKNAISKFGTIGDKKSALFGIAQNQLGLVCVQLYAINEAADHFEEARRILETEYGHYHPDTLGVYSNLAGTYDAMGRWDDAFEVLEKVVGMREEKLGTANPEVNDEKRRLCQLLKEAGKVRNHKSRSLEALLDNNSRSVAKNDTCKAV
jgi:tetratricopeptide (TPR) repeat protein